MKFFYDFFFIFFGFWFWFFLSRYSRGAWCFIVDIGLGWGWGSLYNMGKVLPSTGPTGTCYLFLLMRWEEEWKGMGGRAASGRFLLEIENRQKSATVGLGGGVCFYEVGWLVVLPYLRYLCRRYR